MVFELLLADQPAREAAHDPQSKLWGWADRLEMTASRFPERAKVSPDSSHGAIAVNLDACIHCNLCVRACREVQVNDVIGLAYRGHGAKIVFDFDQPMGESTCVACGECVQACPTGALMEANLLDEKGVRSGYEERGRRHPLPLLRRRLPDPCARQGRAHPLHRRPRRASQQQTAFASRAASASTTSNHPHRLTKPLIRREDAPKSGDIQIDPANPWTHFREASWEEALEAAAGGLKTVLDRDGPSAMAGFGSAKGSNEEGLPVPEAGAHRLRHQ